MREMAAGVALAVTAAIVVVGVPVALRVRDLWDASMSWWVLIAAPGTVLTLGLAFAWAWRNRPPAVDPAFYHTTTAALGMGTKALDLHRKVNELPAPMPDEWAQGIYRDVTTGKGE